MENKSAKWFRIVLFMLIFAGIFIFFAVRHPLVILDADDWLFVSYNRLHATPIWQDWNPTRVLPEILMPFAGKLAVLLIYPITGKYITALSIMFAVVITLFIMVYFVLFCRLIREEYKLTIGAESVTILTFVAVHFWIYLTADSGNSYMFSEANVTCVFFYVISALMNAIVVVYLMKEKEFDFFSKDDNYFVKGIVLLGIYLSINSNMLQSIILISFVGMMLLKNLISIKKEKGWLLKYIKINRTWFLVVIAWFVSLYYEINGGRADDLKKESFMSELSISFKKLIELFTTRWNRTFIAFSVAFVVIAVVLYLLKKEKEVEDYKYRKNIFITAGAMIVHMVYTVLICAKTSPEYMDRSGVVFGISFYFILISVMSLAYILSRKPALMVIMPIFVLFVFHEITLGGRYYVECNVGSYSAKECTEVNEKIIYQVKRAEDKGKNKVTVYVPEYHTDDNWPIALYSSDFIAGTLQSHGVTDGWLRITIEPNQKKFNKIKIPVNS